MHQLALATLHRQGPLMTPLLPQTERVAIDADGHRNRTGTVLLVDDEDTVRSMLRFALQRAGFEVLEARTGSEARHLCQEYPGPIHLLLADVLVVPMGNRQLL